MIYLQDYTKDLVERDGLFFSKHDSIISYPETGNNSAFEIEQHSFWFKHRNNCIAEGVLRYAPDQLFFDIGGGNGFVSKGLEERGVSTVLVEPGIQGCLNAKKRNLTHIVCASLENATFKLNSIPSIGLFDVLEHIDKDVEFLTGIHDYLKENGLVFITVPAYNTLWSNDDVYAGHFRRHTIGGLEKKLRSIGFIVEYSTYIFSISPLAVLVFRTIPSWLGLNKNPGNQEKHKKAHEQRRGIVDKILNRLWDFELNRIRKGRVIPFGGSCFVIARKVSKRS